MVDLPDTMVDLPDTLIEAAATGGAGAGQEGLQPLQGDGGGRRRP